MDGSYRGEVLQPSSNLRQPPRKPRHQNPQQHLCKAPDPEVPNAKSGKGTTSTLLPAVQSNEFAASWKLDDKAADDAFSWLPFVLSRYSDADSWAKVLAQLVLDACGFVATSAVADRI